MTQDNETGQKFLISIDRKYVVTCIKPSEAKTLIKVMYMEHISMYVCLRCINASEAKTLKEVYVCMHACMHVLTHTHMYLCMYVYMFHKSFKRSRKEFTKFMRQYMLIAFELAGEDRDRR